MAESANVGEKRSDPPSRPTTTRKRRRITATTPMVTVYEDEIFDLHNQGRKPKQIVTYLTSKHGLAKGDLTPRAVSDKIGRMIKMGFVSPSPTNLSTGVRADVASQRPGCWLEDTERDLAEGRRVDGDPLRDFIIEEPDEVRRDSDYYYQEISDFLVSAGKYYTAEDDSHFYVWIRKFHGEKCTIGTREPDGFTVTWNINGPTDQDVRKLGLRGVQVLFQQHPTLSWKIRSTRTIETARDRWVIKKFTPERDEFDDSSTSLPFRWIGLKIPFKVLDDDEIVISDSEDSD